MNRKEELRKKLDTITLPIDKPDTTKPAGTYDKIYLPVLEELGVSSQIGVDMLRAAVEDKLLYMSDELRKQTLEALMSGKIKDVKSIPLYRDNGVIRNIPNSFAPWISFMAWLNERGNALF